MGLVAIPGKPGQFFDTDRQAVQYISEGRWGTKYDMVYQVAGAVAAGTQLFWFRDLQNKNKIDTNLVQQGRIGANEAMKVYLVGFYVPTAFGNVVPVPADIKKMYEDLYLELKFNETLFAEGAGIEFPSGYGLAGNTTENNAGIVSNGTPSTAAARLFAEPQVITDRYNLQGVGTFFGRAWAVAGLVPTFATAMMGRLSLVGKITSASTI